ncbi:hypothetical protein MNEG_15654 [Monoraphidium neglectum]|uniref:Uncharacterized protein n=1 Tax=Monoraphidium neglectum TaxID=145388 RepID=A0A0D2LK01_9CHLO|nr:hypothetical protein MNEG_15654 [Monoraphidium neglectum]KIY92309.1 hypothetical protein MNEG_15654 [Monoraphidium neglectum]|eukprot:XP_013891329.1 hypothetical protein MNEG_15654 [Monoraphidium neglectum]
MKGRSSRRAEVWAAVTGDALEIRSWEGRRGARAATPLYEVPAALYARWGEEGDMPFFVRGVINVGFSPQLRNFVFKVAYYGFEFNGYTASLAGANPDCKP